MIYSNYHIVFIKKKKKQNNYEENYAKMALYASWAWWFISFFPLYNCYSVTIFFPYQYGTQYEMVMWQDHEHEVGFGHSWMRTIINTHTKKKNEKKKN